MRQTLSRGMVVAAAATSILSLYSSQAFADSDASGVAADSPGVLSGNAVQAPVDVPVNACGNSVDVVAALNPAFGNSCVTPTGKHRKPDRPHHGAPSGHGASSGHGTDHGNGSGRHGDPGHGPGHGQGQGQGQGHGPGHGQGRGDGPGSGHGHGGSGHHDNGSATHGSAAHGTAHGSPGAGTGNVAGVPVDVPVNACGNTVDVIALLNPVFGNECDQQDGPKGHDHEDDGPHGYGDDGNPPSEPPSTPPGHPPTTTPPTAPPNTTGPPQTVPHTPSTSEGPRPELAETGSGGMIANSAVGVGLLLGGAVLYRRNRAASRQW